MQILYVICIIVIFFYFFKDRDCIEYDSKIYLSQIKNKYPLKPIKLKTIFNGVQITSYEELKNFNANICRQRDNYNQIVNNLKITCAYDSFNPNLAKTPENLSLTEYKKGLYGASWYAYVEDFSFSVYPVKAFKNEYFTNENQGYAILKNDKSLLKIPTQINSYQGDKSTLIRGFMEKNKYNIICYDAIFNLKNPKINKLTFYYLKNKYLFKKELKLQKVGI